MRLPRGFADDVKNQSDIVRVISDYVSLKKRGANHMACCPFHSEKTPSFSVSQPKGLYKCFGCGAGGSVFDFVMRIEGCQFPEAVRIVAEKSGIPIPAVDETEDYKKTQHDRDVVLRLNDLAAKFFEMNLLDDDAGATARAYVESRGISDETRALFRLGYAPDSWDALIHFLRGNGASDEDLTISGLVVPKDTGGFYDRFRGRLMFPIADSQGRVLAFGGRVMGEGEPKYLNSPETAVYTKGRNLYGLAYSKNDIRNAGYAILVEGYLDCIIPYQAGIHNIVASLGTALTDSQVRLLRRYMDAPQIIVNFDPDSAGQNATMRSIEMLLIEGFKVNILKMPTDDDPDEYVRAYGGDAFRALLKTTQPYIEYIIDMTIAKHDITRPAGKVEAVNAIMPHLARMRDKVARADYSDQIANRLKVDSRVIRDEMRRVAVNRQQTLDPKRLRAAADVTQAERQLLELILAHGDVRRAIVTNLQQEDYADLAMGAVFAAVVQVEREGLEPDFDNISARLESEEERAMLPALLMSDLEWAGGLEFETLFKKATEALSSLRRKQIERRLEVIHIELGQAASEQNELRVRELYTEKAELNRRKLAIAASPAES
ncbi:MAG: DNA primase [Blastocatellia bacterium]